MDVTAHVYNYNLGGRVSQEDLEFKASFGYVARNEKRQDKKRKRRGQRG